MKLLRLTAENFGSYPSLELDLSDTGLALIYGPTGAGKSTVMDAAAWILYGTTAKGGAVDQVRSWQTPHQPTRGTLYVEISHGSPILAVTRVRGKQPDNDLYWTEQGSDHQHRGKDLKDTQRLLDQRLGSSAPLYTLASYFHEFSPAGQFFTASAKERRNLFERIADTNLPDKLASGASEARKSVRGELETVQRARDKQDGVLGQLRQSYAAMVRSCRDWQEHHDGHVRELQARSKGFEVEKASKIEALETRSTRWEQEKCRSLEDLIAKIEAAQSKIHPESLLMGLAESAEAKRCKSCGGIPEKAAAYLAKLEAAKADNVRYTEKVEALKDRLATENDSENPFTDQIEAARASENHFAGRIAEEQEKANPFTEQLGSLQAAIKEAYGSLQATISEVAAHEHRIALLSRLYDLSATLRGELLKQAVAEIEAATNRYLETYFDAELRVSFQLEADDLEVSIQKSGYDCVYPQLSKGQRQLLKLAFGASVMKASANAAGLHFSCLFFDEALDGLDAALKVKAFSLLEELSLEHESVFVIDHSTELKELFSRRYAVTLIGDESRIACED